MKKRYSILSIQEWGLSTTNIKPLIIAGPCSAESYEQLYNTVEGLVKIPQVSIIRVGIWKPRTLPEQFEGAGNVAIEWIKEIRNIFNIPIAVEVLKPEHIDICLKNDINIIWLGTRTVSNPYSVQEIANALKKTSFTVLIKNPMTPDLKLWLGAFERIYNAGIQKIALIHRGFYPYEYTTLRNIPKWEIVIDLRMLHPEIPIICDPSHIAGKKDLVSGIAQKAMDLCYDGLMIESHCCPEKALSDKQQQLTPLELQHLIHSLILCNTESDKEHIELVRLREKIDSIDYQLLELLAQRMNVVRQMAEYKRKHNISALQLKRWKEIINTRLQRAKDLNMNLNFVKQMLEIIHIEALKIQENEKNKNSSD